MIPTRKSCKGCIFLKPFGGTGRTSEKGCHYCFITGEPRGCPVDACTRKKLVPKSKQKKEAGSR